MKKPTLLATAATALAGLPALVSSSFHCASSAFIASARRVHSNRSGRRRDNDVMPTSATPPGKGDLYNDDELFELLNLHQSLNPKEEKGLFSQEDSGTLNEESIAGGIHDWVLAELGDAEEKSYPANGIGQNGSPTEASAIPGLHEWVLETIEDINSSSSSSEIGDDSPINQLAYDNLRALLRDKKPSIRAIATDVDGTLLSGQTLHPITQEAVLNGITQSYNSSETQKIQHFFPATGKSRKGAEISLGPIIGPLLYQIPGVYIQGLYCVDKEGNVVFEKKLSQSAVRAAEAVVSDFCISIVGYDGDDLYTTEKTDVVLSLSEYYGEPTVEFSLDEDGSVLKLAEHGPLHKLLLMDEDAEKLTKVVRPKLEELAEKHGATVTQAIPTMLELLPGGCSKANGVGKLCEALGIDVAEELLALGDAENDAGMLKNAAIGVAVGNACPQARDASDFIMRERNDEGG
ncbi:hypothetical protein ACHAXR_001339, partial [Thalassiosira sp. AJA248-18]